MLWKLPLLLLIMFFATIYYYIMTCHKNIYFTVKKLPVTSIAHKLPYPTEVFLFDFNLDGRQDFILTGLEHPVQNNKLVLLKNVDNKKFLDVSTNALGNIFTEHIRHINVADYNGDGLNDLLIADQGPDSPPFRGGKSRLLFNLNNKRFKDVTNSNLPHSQAFTFHLASGDIDNDGDIDIFFSDNDFNGNANIFPHFYINNGNGVFKKDYTRLPHFISNKKKTYLACILLDIDNDKDLDLILGGMEGTSSDAYFSRDTLLINNGSGQFKSAPEENMPLRIGGSSWATISFIPIDLNNDGYIDFITSNHNPGWSKGAIQIIINNGDQTFRELKNNINYQVTGDYWIPWVKTGDVNGDGFLDFAFTIRFSQNTNAKINQPIKIFQNMQDETFKDISSYIPATNKNYSSLHFIHLNSDKYADLFLTDYQNYYYLLTNQGIIE